MTLLKSSALLYACCLGVMSLRASISLLLCLSEGPKMVALRVAAGAVKDQNPGILVDVATFERQINDNRIQRLQSILYGVAVTKSRQHIGRWLPALAWCWVKHIEYRACPHLRLINAVSV